MIHVIFLLIKRFRALCVLYWSICNHYVSTLDQVWIHICLPALTLEILVHDPLPTLLSTGRNTSEFKSPRWADCGLIVLLDDIRLFSVIIIIVIMMHWGTDKPIIKVAIRADYHHFNAARFEVVSQCLDMQSPLFYFLTSVELYRSFLDHWNSSFTKDLYLRVHLLCVSEAFNNISLCGWSSDFSCFPHLLPSYHVFSRIHSKSWLHGIKRSIW